VRHSLGIEPLNFVHNAHVLLNRVGVFINCEVILIDSEGFMCGRLPVNFIESKLFAIEEGCNFVNRVVSGRVQDTQSVELERHLVGGF
jgi:hypothetical protein